jgi:hypothetical protein
MVRIAISQAAFDAVAPTLPLGSVGYENKTNEKGERLISGWSQVWSTASGPRAALARATATLSCGWWRNAANEAPQMKCIHEAARAACNSGRSCGAAGKGRRWSLIK